MTGFPRTISALQREHPKPSLRNVWGVLGLVGLLILWAGYFFFGAMPLYKTAYLSLPQSMPFTVDFPAEDALTFRVGQSAQLRLDRPGSQSIPARVVGLRPGKDGEVTLELETSPTTKLAAYFDQNTRILVAVEIGHSSPAALLVHIALPHAS